MIFNPPQGGFFICRAVVKRRWIAAFSIIKFLMAFGCFFVIIIKAQGVILAWRGIRMVHETSAQETLRQIDAAGDDPKKLSEIVSGIKEDYFSHLQDNHNIIAVQNADYAKVQKAIEEKGSIADRTKVLTSLHDKLKDTEYYESAYEAARLCAIFADKETAIQAPDMMLDIFHKNYKKEKWYGEDITPVEAVDVIGVGISQYTRIYIVNTKILGKEHKYSFTDQEKEVLLEMAEHYTDCSVNSPPDEKKKYQIGAKAALDSAFDGPNELWLKTYKKVAGKEPEIASALIKDMLSNDYGLWKDGKKISQENTFLQDLCKNFAKDHPEMALEIIKHAEEKGSNPNTVKFLQNLKGKAEKYKDSYWPRTMLTEILFSKQPKKASKIDNLLGYRK